jgi:hypothetical protein
VPLQALNLRFCTIFEKFAHGVTMMVPVEQAYIADLLRAFNIKDKALVLHLRPEEF